MIISFEDSHPYTRLTISGNASIYFNFIIDTGATRSAFPREHCGELGLTFSGNERTITPYGEDILHLFDAHIQIADRHFDIPIACRDQKLYLLGLDILCRYRLYLDWISNPPNGRGEY
jgi:hypothetical protein